jgi:hypothetical protein
VRPDLFPDAKLRKIGLVEVDQNLANFLNGILELFYYTETKIMINLSLMFVFIIFYIMTSQWL